MKNLLKILLLVFNIIAVLALIMAYLSGYISPVKWWIPSFFGLAYPVIVLVNIAFVVLWLIISPRYLLISLVALLAGWGFLSRFVQLNEKNIEKGDIKVLSYNVQHFFGNGNEQQKETALEITNFLKEQEADIICLQEVRLRHNSIFNLAETIKELDFIHHYQFARSSTTYGSVTLTRYPIIYMGEIRFDDSRNISIYTDLKINDDTLRVYNVHLQSYQIDPLRFSIIDSGIDEEADLKEVKELGSRFKIGFERRARQVEILQEHIKSSPWPVIVCGDLNDTPASFSYQQLRKGLTDAFQSSGSGIGRTYVGKLPSFRIDYIFHSPGYVSFNFKTHEFRESDHLPVSAELIKK